METSNCQSEIEPKSEEVEVKAEEKFSATEEFEYYTRPRRSIQTVSIAFLREETSQATTSDNNLSHTDEPYEPAEQRQDVTQTTDNRLSEPKKTNKTK